MDSLADSLARFARWTRLLILLLISFAAFSCRIPSLGSLPGPARWTRSLILFLILLLILFLILLLILLLTLLLDSLAAFSCRIRALDPLTDSLADSLTHICAHNHASHIRTHTTFSCATRPRTDTLSKIETSGARPPNLPTPGPKGRPFQTGVPESNKRTFLTPQANKPIPCKRRDSILPKAETCAVTTTSAALLTPGVVSCRRGSLRSFPPCLVSWSSRSSSSRPAWYRCIPGSLPHTRCGIVVSHTPCVVSSSSL